MVGDVAINRDRLEAHLNEMGAIGEGPEGTGRTRLALSEEDRRGRDLLRGWMRELDLTIHVDPIGNFFGIREGRDSSLSPVVMGSHLDTVIEAGMYDGAVGVLSALEVVKCLVEEGIETLHPVGVGCFTNEEGVRFQPDMMGSLVASGGYPLEKAYARADDEHITVREALESIGYLGRERFLPGAYFEFHVEQGPVLHRRGVQVGVVQGVQGMEWWRVRFRGEANHAGTTPLGMRKDAMRGAAELYTALLSMTEKLGSSVCTMGKLRLEPNAINVVPGVADFTIDFRSHDDAAFEAGRREVARLIEETAGRLGLRAESEVVVDAKPVHFRAGMVDLVESEAVRRGYSTLRLPSGAGHDAQFMHTVCPTAMIFVPSINGVSHSPEERSTIEDIERGANVLLGCALATAAKRTID